MSFLKRWGLVLLAFVVGTWAGTPFKRMVTERALNAGQKAQMDAAYAACDNIIKAAQSGGSFTCVVEDGNVSVLDGAVDLPA